MLAITEHLSLSLPSYSTQKVCGSMSGNSFWVHKSWMTLPEIYTHFRWICSKSTPNRRVSFYLWIKINGFNLCTSHSQRKLGGHVKFVYNVSACCWDQRNFAAETVRCLQELHSHHLLLVNMILRHLSKASQNRMLYDRSVTVEISWPVCLCRLTRPSVIMSQVILSTTRLLHSLEEDWLSSRTAKSLKIWERLCAPSHRKIKSCVHLHRYVFLQQLQAPVSIPLTRLHASVSSDDETSSDDRVSTPPVKTKRASINQLISASQTRFYHQIQSKSFATRILPLSRSRLPTNSSMNW